MSKEINNDDEIVGIRLKKIFVNPNKLETVFVNEMTVQQYNDMVMIGFYRLEPPLILGEEDKEKFLEQETINAVLTAKIVVRQDFIPNLIQALEKNMKPIAKGKK